MPGVKRCHVPPSLIIAAPLWELGIYHTSYDISFIDIEALKALYLDKTILTEEEYRRVVEDGRMWNEELALAVVLKTPEEIQNTLDALKEYSNGDQWYHIATQSIKGLHCCTDSSALHVID